MSSKKKRGLKGNSAQSPASSQDYEKLLNDQFVNKLKLSDDGPEYLFNINDFEELETINTSNHVIKRMFHKRFQKELVVKFVHIPYNRNNTEEENAKKLKSLVREIHNFRELKNEPHIVKFYGFCVHEGQALICMELMDLSIKELSLKIIEKNKRLSENLLGCIIVAILDALKACKEKNIIHRDVKPDNVLLRRDGSIKLSDFGASRILEGSLATTFIGTLCYWPPERFSPEQASYDVRADIWSLGITIIELVTGSVPYKDSKGRTPTNIILIQNLIGTLNTTKTINESLSGYSDELKEFVKLCLNNVEERPKYAELMETKFYKNCKSFDASKIVQSAIEEYYHNEVLPQPNPNVNKDVKLPQSQKTDSNVLVGSYSDSESGYSSKATTLESSTNVSVEYVIHDKNSQDLLQLHRDINAVFEKLNKLDKHNHSGAFIPIFNEMFSLFYYLETMDNSAIIFDLLKNQNYDSVKKYKQPMISYFHYFQERIEFSHGEGEELEAKDFCMIRSGIECFMNIFEEIRDETKEHIEELDEDLMNWNKYYCCIPPECIPEKFEKDESNTHWWWYRQVEYTSSDPMWG